MLPALVHILAWYYWMGLNELNSRTGHRAKESGKKILFKRKKKTHTQKSNEELLIENK